MNNPRISTARGYRREDYHFDRRQPPHLHRIPWETERDTFPPVNWWLVGDGAVVVACLICVALIFLGVIP